MPDTTPRGIPYPTGAELADGPGQIGALAAWVDAEPGIRAVTAAQRDALPVARKPVGLVVWNSTSLALERWDGATWGALAMADAVAAGYLPKTLLTTKGDLLTATGPGAPARLPVGAAGQLLAAAPAAAAGVAWADPDDAADPLVNRGMEIWQRGTSGAMSTGAGAGRAWACDRWLVWRGFWANGGSWQRLALTRAVDAAPARYALRLARAAGDTATYELICGQGVESGLSWPWAGRQATVSAWLRAGPGLTGTVRLQLAAGTGTDEDLAAGFTGQTYPVDATAAVTAGGPFVRVTGTGTVPAGATQLGVRVAWTPTGTAPAGAWLDVAAVQLDAGPVARPWRGEEPSGLLAACRRTYRPLAQWDLYGVVHETTGPAAVLRAAWDPPCAPPPRSPSPPGRRSPASATPSRPPPRSRSSR